MSVFFLWIVLLFALLQFAEDIKMVKKFWTEISGTWKYVVLLLIMHVLLKCMQKGPASGYPRLDNGNLNLI